MRKKDQIGNSMEFTKLLVCVLKSALSISSICNNPVENTSIFIKST